MTMRPFGSRPAFCGARLFSSYAVCSDCSFIFCATSLDRGDVFDVYICEPPTPWTASLRRHGDLSLRIVAQWTSSPLQGDYPFHFRSRRQFASSAICGVLYLDIGVHHWAHAQNVGPKGMSVLFSIMTGRPRPHNDRHWSPIRIHFVERYERMVATCSVPLIKSCISGVLLLYMLCES